ncbi:unnamed protein product [Closterium sp. NIES-54]
MARKRKGQALNDCPKDLDDIPYIRWMNQQIANGHHPKGLSAPPVLDGQGSTAQSPSAAMSRVRRQPARTAATHRLQHTGLSWSKMRTMTTPNKASTPTTTRRNWKTLGCRPAMATTKMRTPRTTRRRKRNLCL